jgi:hypothetical protein
MFDEMPRLRCPADQPELSEAVVELLSFAPTDEVRQSLSLLAEAIGKRTALRPKAVTVEAVGEAFEELLKQMVDERVFVCRHKMALQYLQVKV